MTPLQIVFRWKAATTSSIVGVSSLMAPNFLRSQTADHRSQTAGQRNTIYISNHREKEGLNTIHAFRPTTPENHEDHCHLPPLCPPLCCPSTSPMSNPSLTKNQNSGANISACRYPFNSTAPTPWFSFLNAYQDVNDLKEPRFQQSWVY